MKIYYDFEFYENGNIIEPISVGMVTHTGREFYAINTSFPEKYWSDWLTKNVKPYLNTAIPAYNKITTGNKNTIKDAINEWLLENVKDKAELIGYYADYDHVCLSQLYGSMVELPKHVPMYTKDIKQWLEDLGNPKIPFRNPVVHNSLSDARWTRDAYMWLSNTYKHPAWQ